MRSGVIKEAYKAKKYNQNIIKDYIIIIIKFVSRN